MANYKFQLNPKEPGDEQVNRHRDFGKVMENYQKMTNPLYRTPLYRYRGIFLGVMIVLTLTWMIVEFGGTKEEKTKQQNDSAQKADSLLKRSEMKQGPASNR